LCRQQAVGGAEDKEVRFMRADGVMIDTIEADDV
jgi:hypothetical protein